MNKWWVALALALVAAGGVAAWWLAAPHQDREVALPADDATDLEMRALRGDDSLGDGSMTWGYRLRRSSDDGPWRIFDQGHG